MNANVANASKPHHQHHSSAKLHSQSTNVESPQRSKAQFNSKTNNSSKHSSLHEGHDERKSSNSKCSSHPSACSQTIYANMPAAHLNSGRMSPKSACDLRPTSRGSPMIVTPSAMSPKTVTMAHSSSMSMYATGAGTSASATHQARDSSEEPVAGPSGLGPVQSVPLVSSQSVFWIHSQPGKISVNTSVNCPLPSLLKRKLTGIDQRTNQLANVQQTIRWWGITTKWWVMQLCYI